MVVRMHCPGCEKGGRGWRSGRGYRQGGGLRRAVCLRACLLATRRINLLGCLHPHTRSGAGLADQHELPTSLFVLPLHVPPAPPLYFPTPPLPLQPPLKADLDSVRYQVCRLMRMLVQICQTLDKVPSQVGAQMGVHAWWTGGGVDYCCCCCGLRVPMAMRQRERSQVMQHRCTWVWSGGLLREGGGGDAGCCAPYMLTRPPAPPRLALPRPAPPRLADVAALPVHEADLPRAHAG